MLVKQAYELVNSTTKEILGDSVVINEDLTNVVDLGKALYDANAVDNYVKTLVDRIGKVIFVNRKYSGSAPSIMRDGWEWGSVLQKIRADLPDAVVNESWQLTAKTSYDPNVYNPPKVANKFFNSKLTFEIDLSITKIQVQESFTSPVHMNAFLDMIYNKVETKMTIAFDGLIRSTINNMIGETIYAENKSGSSTYTTQSGVRAVNLLYLFNQQKGGEALTKDKALTNAEFLKFATYTINNYIERMKGASKLYNVNGTEKFTPEDLLHVVLLSDFANASASYLQADTFHKELVSLPKYEKTVYWQGSGKKASTTDCSTINVKTSANHSVNLDGVIGVLFDHDACGVCNTDRRSPTEYNAKGEFWNIFYKFDGSFFNDLDENCVVFFIQ